MVKQKFTDILKNRITQTIGAIKTRKKVRKPDMTLPMLMSEMQKIQCNSPSWNWTIFINSFFSKEWDLYEDSKSWKTYWNEMELINIQIWREILVRSVAIRKKRKKKKSSHYDRIARLKKINFRRYEKMTRYNYLCKKITIDNVTLFPLLRDYGPVSFKGKKKSLVLLTNPRVKLIVELKTWLENKSQSTEKKIAQFIFMMCNIDKKFKNWITQLHIGTELSIVKWKATYPSALIFAQLYDSTHESLEKARQAKLAQEKEQLEKQFRNRASRYIILDNNEIAPTEEALFFPKTDERVIGQRLTDDSDRKRTKYQSVPYWFPRSQEDKEKGIRPFVKNVLKMREVLAHKECIRVKELSYKEKQNAIQRFNDGATLYESQGRFIVFILKVFNKSPDIFLLNYVHRLEKTKEQLADEKKFKLEYEQKALQDSKIAKNTQEKKAAEWAFKNSSIFARQKAAAELRKREIALLEQKSPEELEREKAEMLARQILERENAAKMAKFLASLPPGYRVLYDILPGQFKKKRLHIATRWIALKEKQRYIFKKRVAVSIYHRPEKRRKMRNSFNNRTYFSLNAWFTKYQVWRRKIKWRSWPRQWSWLERAMSTITRYRAFNNKKVWARRLKKLTYWQFVKKEYQQPRMCMGVRSWWRVYPWYYKGGLFSKPLRKRFVPLLGSLRYTAKRVYIYVKNADMKQNILFYKKIKRVKQMKHIVTRIFQKKCLTVHRFVVNGFLRNVVIFKGYSVKKNQWTLPAEYTVDYGSFSLDFNWRQAWAALDVNEFFKNTQVPGRLINLIALDVYAHYITNMQGAYNGFATVLDLKNQKFDEHARMLSKYSDLLERYYQMVYTRKVAKNIPASTAMYWIREYIRLTDNSGREIQAWNRFKTVELHFKPAATDVFIPARKKKSVFRLKILFDRLFIWLYAQSNVRYALASPIRKKELQNYLVNTQFLYKKKFKVKFSSK